MTPAEIRTMPDASIVEMLVSLNPSDEAVAWLASVIADPSKAAGVAELSRRYQATRKGQPIRPRARAASSVLIDPCKFKAFFWDRRIPLGEVGPMVGKCSGFASVIAYKGRISYWTADAIANELGVHIDAFIAQVGTDEELKRLSA